jgi:GMP synthase-like glutamine amidotransferase
MLSCALISVSSPWEEQGGETYHRLWLDALRKQKEGEKQYKWLLFNAYDEAAGALPTEEQLRDVEALCVVGLDYGRNQWTKLRQEAWAQKLVDLIKRQCCIADGGEGKGVGEGRPLRIFGCGLGSHAVAEAIGCVVEGNPGGCGPVLGATGVHASPALVDTMGGWLRETRSNSLSPPPRIFKDGSSQANVDFGSTLFLLESHAEQVSQLPEGKEQAEQIQILASSKKTQAEIWTWKDSVLAYQCHPELTPALFRANVLQSVFQAGQVDAGKTKDSISEDLDAALDSEVLMAMARHFIRGNSLQPSSSTSVPPMGLVGGTHATGGGGFGSPLGLDEASRLALLQNPGDQQQLSSVLETAKKMFHSISEAVKGEFRIPQMEYQLLGKMNKLATEKYNHLADFTAGLAVFVESLREKEESLGPLASQIEELENQLGQLEQVVMQLDAYSRRLENRVKKYVFS